MNRAGWLAVLLCLPVAAVATTGEDLSERLRVDGAIADFQPDEWVLGPHTPFPERRSDSRWGGDNDVSRLAVTWDHRFLYVAVDGVVADDMLIGFLAVGSGGVSDLSALPAMRRNIVLTAMSANVIFSAGPASGDADVFTAFSTGPVERVDPTRYSSRFLQSTGGPLELALPWEELSPSGPAIDLLVAVTAGPGSGAGDAAPDASGLLSNDPAHRAYLDNALRITFDGDGDGVPDAGVSPVSVTTSLRAVGSVAREGRPFDVSVERKVVSPDNGESVRFRVTLDSDEAAAPLFLTARVFDAGGNLVTVLFRDGPRTLQPGASADWDEWDCTDASGAPVPAGIYIIGVTGGVSSGAETKSARAAVSVVR